MATRGHLGGLAAATADVIRVLDAAGRDPILVETVGVGQDEIDIVKLADVSVVVLVPGMGDDIQALKAGIMEIGDIFVINKSDREGAFATEKELQALLSLVERGDAWDPPIVKTVATENSGISDLANAIDQFCEAQKAPETTNKRRRAIARWRIVELLRERLLSSVLDSINSSAALDRLADEVATRRRDPYSAVDEIIRMSRQ
jgi:LAO/AO transport system kinase